MILIYLSNFLPLPVLMHGQEAEEKIVEKEQKEVSSYYLTFTIMAILKLNLIRDPSPI